MKIRYENPKDNLADIASRGCKLKELLNNSLWWQGPQWLTKKSEEWPTWDSHIVNTNELMNDNHMDPKNK